MKKIVQREWYIVLHGQEASFRKKKWIMICIILAVIYGTAGVSAVWSFLKIAFIFALFVHFLFRYYTHGWTKPWWIMKKVVKTPFDK